MHEAADVRRSQQEWADAIVTNDVELIAACQTEDWSIVTKNGITGGDAFLAAIRGGVLSHTRMEPVGEPLISVYGDVAVLSVRVVSTEIHAGERIENDEWTTTVFLRAKDRWLAARTQLTPASQPQHH